MNTAKITILYGGKFYPLAIIFKYDYLDFDFVLKQIYIQ